ncbi:ChaN family lipoprotein [Tropicibacter sp. Alg240-R139]|uniref:ChaN family lipoprotein n=1 Tax=Tropicibacter sp. Alg240-R139 TaxID=2305991 RepID=UPI0013DFC6B4|nr:ChaN family lipoprotein [Tropicibacter sp. Alg240-R139]
MRHVAILICACVAFLAAPIRAALASELVPDEILLKMAGADVVILGEVHDNPVHHRVQRDVVAALEPRAMVWEMLTAEGADRINRNLISEPEKLAATIRWAELGWPPLSMYLPIFVAAPDAPIYGALVPREAAQGAMEAGAAVAFGADAARYGLNVPLPADEQASREAGQMAAHCDAMPAEKLPVLVQIQRLRDAVLTRAILTAITETGGPVVVITGNGHARKDWGVPSFLTRMQPGLRVFALGQSEEGAIQGSFDAILDAPEVERDDPCAVFHKAVD